MSWASTSSQSVSQMERYVPPTHVSTVPEYTRLVPWRVSDVSVSLRSKSIQLAFGGDTVTFGGETVTFGGKPEMEI